MYWKTITIACIYPALFSLRYFDLVSKANYNLENTNIYIIVFPIQEFQRKDMSSSVDTNEKKLYFTFSYIFLTIFLLPKIENEIVFAFRTIIEFILFWGISFWKNSMLHVSIQIFNSEINNITRIKTWLSFHFEENAATSENVIINTWYI